MRIGDDSTFTIHEDQALFRESVDFTAARLGFSRRLIEKDYFCSLALGRLAGQEVSPLVFKGGTCLAKIHSEFYRMSEDLDFSIPVAVDVKRSERRKLIAEVKTGFASVPDFEPAFFVKDPLRGANESRQYLGCLGYRSLLESRDETIKIEIALREPLLSRVKVGSARTILLDPITARPFVPAFPLRCIPLIEAFAEKFRAALTRRELAIRDFFDIDYGVRKLGIQPDDSDLIGLVRQKLSIPGNTSIDISQDRLADLERQLNSILKPVLRLSDFEAFDLQRALAIVERMADVLERSTNR